MAISLLDITPGMERPGIGMRIKKGRRVTASLNNAVGVKAPSCEWHVLFDEHLVLAVDVQTSGCGLAL